MSLRRRIKALEAKHGGGDLVTIVVSGGPPDPQETADVRLAETFEDYRARRQAEAQASGQKILVIHKWTGDHHGT